MSLFLRFQVMVVTGVAAWGCFTAGELGYTAWMVAICSPMVVSVIWQFGHSAKGSEVRS